MSAVPVNGGKESRAALVALLRGLSQALAGILVIGAAIWLVLPRLSATGYIANGSSGPVTLPWVFHEITNGNRLEVHLHGTWLTPGRWNIVPDDRLTALRVNGQDVPLDGVRPGGLNDWKRGFEIDLSPWLHGGDNTLEFTVDNYAWNGGLALRPLLGWRWLLLGAGFLPWLLLLAHWFRLHRAQTAVLAAALVPLCTYLAATPWNVRQHDVDVGGGHLAHILYIATHHVLPHPDMGWTFFHPPLYYVTGAAVWNWAQWLGLPGPDSLQFLALALWLVFLAASAGALRLTLRRPPRSLMLATMALALWPAGFMHGLSLGNDTALYATAAVASWFMLRWWRSGKRSHLLGMAVFIALALLAKSNALVLAAAAALLLGLRLLHHRSRARLWIDATLAGAIVAAGIALSLGNQIYLYWRGEIAYWLIANVQTLPAGLRVPVSVGAFLPLNVPAFLTSPWLDPYDDATGRANFWNYLLRSALSGEFHFDGATQRVIACIWGVLLLWLLWLLLLPRRSLAWSRRTLWRESPWIALSVLWLTSLAALRIKTPYACSNDFRYILPLLVPFILACVRAGPLARILLLALALASLPFVMLL